VTVTDHVHPSVASSLELDAIKDNRSISTYSGKKFDPLADSSDILRVISIDDIAHGLANTCRYNGQVDFYSVAEHSVRVAQWLMDAGHDTMTILLGLFHDASEAYIGDIPKPFKGTLTNEAYDFAERSIQYAVHKKFVFEPLHSLRTSLVPTAAQLVDAQRAVKEADYAVYLQERSERPKVGMGLLPRDAWTHFHTFYAFLLQSLS
jgi:5'-deoxynucleotidase YfbR-like HD superfamily hydrolase